MGRREPHIVCGTLTIRFLGAVLSVNITDSRARRCQALVTQCRSAYHHSTGKPAPTPHPPPLGEAWRRVEGGGGAGSLNNYQPLTFTMTCSSPPRRSPPTPTLTWRREKGKVWLHFKFFKVCEKKQISS